jgi:hypothetical protein
MRKIIIGVELCPDMEILLAFNGCKQSGEVGIVLEVVL